MNPPVPTALPSSPLSVEEESIKPEVHDLQGWQRALIFPLGLLIRAWGSTLHFEVSTESEQLLRKVDQPLAFVLWHNRLFVVSEIFRRYRQQKPVYGLVSASRDGAWLTALFSLVGIRTVRGSSSRLGREAITALLGVVRQGNDIGITPDGPRGPAYDFKAGALIVARRMQAPIVLLGGAYESAWRLKSWDGFYLPKPFSRVRLSCVQIAPDTLHDRCQSTQTLRARLIEISPDATIQSGVDSP